MSSTRASKHLPNTSPEIHCREKEGKQLKGRAREEGREGVVERERERVREAEGGGRERDERDGARERVSMAL